MKIENRYVVLDVETNGLSSLRDDLLSISIYKPDDGELYDRFLPLELAKKVFREYQFVQFVHKYRVLQERRRLGINPLTLG